VALLNALAHVVVTEGFVRRPTWRALRAGVVCQVEGVRGRGAQFAGGLGSDHRRARGARAPRGALYATGGNSAIYYGLGVTEHKPGHTASWGSPTSPWPPAISAARWRRKPAGGQNNVQGSCDMGSFPHEFSATATVSDPVVRASFEAAWGVPLQAEPGSRISEHVRGRPRRHLQACTSGRGLRAVRAEGLTAPVSAARRLGVPSHRTGICLNSRGTPTR